MDQAWHDQVAMQELYEQTRQAQQERHMNRSETIGALAKALAAAQAEMHNPQFDSVNPAFKSKFASLASVRNAVVPVLAKNGIALMQDVSIGDYGVSCVTRLFHESGEWMQSMELTVPVAQKSAHGVGSACTYAKRYQLLALACVAGDDDDDANGAVGATPATAKQATPPAAPAVSVSAERAVIVRRVADACIAKFAKDDEFGCYEEAAVITDPEERVLLWNFLHDHSKVRSCIKRIGELERASQKVAA